MYLPEAIRLKTIKIFVQETDADYMRRRHEPRAMIRHMGAITAIQPNNRKTRSLRNLQGLDYVASLRGVREISWFNFDEWLTAKEIVPVRDFTFQQDIMNQAGRKKSDIDHEVANWRRLAPLLQDAGYEPTNADWEALEIFLDGKSTGPPQTELPEEGLVPVSVKPVGTTDCDAIIVSDGDTSDEELDSSSGTPLDDSPIFMEIVESDGDGLDEDSAAGSGTSESGLFVDASVDMDIDEADDQMIDLTDE